METVWDAAAAAQRVRINPGDTAWVLGAAALVMFMTPGLALFYGGMVRDKNVLGMLMQNFFCLGLISVIVVDEDAAPPPTVVEVRAPDHVGLLAQVQLTLDQLKATLLARLTSEYWLPEPA